MPAGRSRAAGYTGTSPLGTVQEQRAGQDGEQHDGGAERGAAVHPGGRAQAVRWDRRWRLGMQGGQGRRSVGMEQPYPIKRVTSDTLASLLETGNRADSM